MKFSTSILLTLVCLASVNLIKAASHRKPSLIGNGVNGGAGCAACTIAVALTEQLSIVYNQTVEKSLDQLCNFLPNNTVFKATCLGAVGEFAPAIINGLYNKETPDVICHLIKICKTDAGQPECTMFPKPKV